MRYTSARSALEALRNALYKFSTYLLTDLLTYSTQPNRRHQSVRCPKMLCNVALQSVMRRVIYTSNFDVHFWATVCKTVCLSYPILSDRSLSCLSVTLVYYGQKVGCIKMPLGTEVDRGPARPHCVRWGPSFPPRKGHSSPHFSAHLYSGQTVAHLSNC